MRSSRLECNVSSGRIEFMPMSTFATRIKHHEVPDHNGYQVVRYGRFDDDGNFLEYNVAGLTQVKDVLRFVRSELRDLLADKLSPGKYTGAIVSELAELDALTLEPLLYGRYLTAAVRIGPRTYAIVDPECFVLFHTTSATMGALVSTHSSSIRVMRVPKGFSFKALLNGRYATYEKADGTDRS